MDDPIRAHLDGELDEQQTAQFRTWLAGDPARLEALLRAARFDQDLRSCAAARVARDRPSLRRPVAMRRRRHAAAGPARWLWPLAAMLVIGCAAGGWLLLRPAPAPGSIAQRPPPARTPEPTPGPGPGPAQAPASAPTPVQTQADPVLVAASPDTRIDDRPVVANHGAIHAINAGAGATLGWRNGTRLRLGPGTTLNVEPGPEVSVRIATGSVAATMPPQATALVTTAHGRARLTGGEIMLSVAAAGTEVDARSGLAVLEDLQGRSLRLDQGGSAVMGSMAAPVRLPGWNYAVDIAANPASAVASGWDGILRHDGLEASFRAEDSAAAGTDVRWISSPRDLTGLARLGPGSRFRIACSVADPCVVSFTLVIHDRTSGQWLGNLHADLHPTPGAAATYDITWQDLTTLVGAAKADLAGQVLMQATLVTGAGDHRLRLHRFDLDGPGL